jgi:Cu(I)/Ag(I) efflux system membrane fusion protein
MDPQVMEKQNVLCPICKMALTKTVIDKTQLNIVKLNADQMKLGNIRVDTVRKSSIGKETILNGVFKVNQNKTEQISSRISGRIEKLYHKIPGEEIRNGEAVYDLYSQELLLAQEEYLIAIDKAKLLGGESFISATKNKLLLWGLSEKQISNLEETKRANITITFYSKVSGTITEISVHEGDIVIEGAKIYQLADLTSLWVEAQIYSNELALLTAGKKVEIAPQGLPEETTEGEITFYNPELQAQTKINIVRIEVDNSRKKFKPGMEANVIHHADDIEAIVVPADAVIHDAKGAVVWIQNSKGGFESRKVDTGTENKNKIEIRNGLYEGERVVTSGAYLINSEYIFKRGMLPAGDMGGMKMDGMKMDSTIN